METNQFTDLLSQRDGVKKETLSLMVELLAEHMMSGNYASDTTKSSEPLVVVYRELAQKTEHLIATYRNRIAQEGIQGNLLNYKICEAIAGLRLHLDLISTIFNSQNIEVQYKKQLLDLFKKHRGDISGDSSAGASYIEQYLKDE